MTITVFSIPISTGPIKFNLLFGGERELRLPEASDHKKRIWERPCEHTSNFVPLRWHFLMTIYHFIITITVSYGDEFIHFITVFMGWLSRTICRTQMITRWSACPNYNFRVLTLTVPQSTTHHSIIINTKWINLFYYFRKNVNFFFNIKTASIAASMNSVLAWVYFKNSIPMYWVSTTPQSFPS